LRYLVAPLLGALMVCLPYESDAQDSDAGLPQGEAPQTAAAPPDFSDFPAQTHLQGPARSPNSRDGEGPVDLFRGEILHRVAQGVNFAGHFSLVITGCGTGCRVAYLVDLITGDIRSFPYGGEAYFEMELDFRADSRLLRTLWVDPDQTATCIQRDMVIEDEGWRVIEETAVRTEGISCR